MADDRPWRRRNAGAAATRVVTFRLTPDEYDELVAFAKASGVTNAMAVYRARALLIGGVLPDPDKAHQDPAFTDEVPASAASDEPAGAPPRATPPFDFQKIFWSPVGEIDRKRRDAAARGALLTNLLYDATLALLDPETDEDTADVLIEEITRQRYPGKNLKTAQEAEALLFLMAVVERAADGLDAAERKVIRNPARLDHLIAAVAKDEAEVERLDPAFYVLFEVARFAHERWQRVWPTYAARVPWTMFVRPIVAAWGGTPKTRTGKLVSKLDALLAVAKRAEIPANKRRLREVWRDRPPSLKKRKMPKKT